MFGVFNITSGIVTNTFVNPDDCLAEVQRQNEENEDQVFTMINI